MNDTPMLKAYVTRSKYREEPREEKHILDVWFDSRPAKAAYYPSREEAESDCKLIFEKGRIQLDTPQGWKHTLNNFRVEQRGARKFVIFCEGPFIIRDGESPAR
jgi:isoleucyl-tRNA synthetase